MKVYTRTGDEGLTALCGGERVFKDSLRVEAYGTVDEVSSWLGLAQMWLQRRESQEILREVQKKLQEVAAELASTDSNLNHLSRYLTAGDIGEMEGIIDTVSAELLPQKGFVLPGGTAGAGHLDVARTVVRRAERVVVALARQEEVRKEIIIYLNRLSDLLYVLARREVTDQVVKQVQDKVKECLADDEQATSILELDRARELIQAAEEKAAELNLPVVTAVVDAGGNLLSLARQDGALLASIDLAQGKAYTAVSLKMPTHELAKLAQPGGALYGIEASNQGRLVVFGGGYPLICKGRVVGGIGVSGGTVEQDMMVAKAALKMWEGVTGYGS